jgi:hypothetical protein
LAHIYLYTFSTCKILFHVFLILFNICFRLMFTWDQEYLYNKINNIKDVLPAKYIKAFPQTSYGRHQEYLCSCSHKVLNFRSFWTRSPICNNLNTWVLSKDKFKIRPFTFGTWWNFEKKWNLVKIFFQTIYFIVF